jgi:hypothetical protein
MDLSYKLDSIPFDKIKSQVNKTLKKYPEIEEKFKFEKIKNIKKIKELLRKFKPEHYPCEFPKDFSKLHNITKEKLIFVYGIINSSLQFQFWDSKTFRSQQIHFLMNDLNKEYFEFFKDKLDNFSNEKIIILYKDFMIDKLLEFFEKNRSKVPVVNLRIETLEKLRKNFSFDNPVFSKDLFRKKHIFGIYLINDLLVKFKVKNKTSIISQFKIKDFHYLYPVDYRLPQALREFFYYPEEILKGIKSELSENDPIEIDLRAISMYYLKNISEEINKEKDIFKNAWLDYALFRYARTLKTEHHKARTTNY